MSHESRSGIRKKPIRVLVLRGVDGAGGGADEIILRNACEIDQERFTLRQCFLRHHRDDAFTFEQRCRELGVDFCQILHKGPLDRTVLPQLRNIIRDFEPNIVHSHEYKANFYNLLASRGERFAKLSTCHGWTGHSWRERFIYYPGDRIILRSFDRLIAVSDDIRHQLTRYGVNKEQVDVVLNGVNPDEFVHKQEIRQNARRQLNVTENDIVIGAVGRIERQKRFDVLVQAIHELKRRGVHVKLFIAGEGSLRTAIEQLIQRLKLSESCKLLGHCPNMKELYQAFDVLAQASDYEGTPTVVVEAMALRVPIVATVAGGTEQLIDDRVHGLLVPCRNATRLAEAIIETIEKKDATAVRVENARQRVETELSFRHRLKKLQSINEQLCTGDD